MDLQKLSLFKILWYNACPITTRRFYENAMYDYISTQRTESGLRTDTTGAPVGSKVKDGVLVYFGIGRARDFENIRHR